MEGNVSLCFVYECVENNLIAQSHIAVSVSSHFRFSFCFLFQCEFWFSIRCHCPVVVVFASILISCLAIHFLQGARQTVIVDPPALRPPHCICPPVRLALQPQQDVLQGSVVHLILLQQLLLAHRVRLALQLVYDRFANVGTLHKTNPVTCRPQRATTRW